MEGSGRSRSATRRSSRGCLPCCDDADCPINVALRPCPEQVSYISATIPFSVEEAKAPTEATNSPNTENVQYSSASHLRATTSCHICNEFMLPTCLCLPSEVRVESNIIRQQLSSRQTRMPICQARLLVLTAPVLAFMECVYVVKLIAPNVAAVTAPSTFLTLLCWKPLPVAIKANFARPSQS